MSTTVRRLTGLALVAFVLLAAGPSRARDGVDLEAGNAGKGLTRSTGAGEGDWRLTLTSDLDLEVLSYIRTTDGFLTAMHDLAPEVDGVHRVAIFNPSSNTSQVSRLERLPGVEAWPGARPRG